ACADSNSAPSRLSRDAPPCRVRRLWSIRTTACAVTGRLAFDIIRQNWRANKYSPRTICEALKAKVLHQRFDVDHGREAGQTEKTNLSRSRGKCSSSMTKTIAFIAYNFLARVAVARSQRVRPQHSCVFLSPIPARLSGPIGKCAT